MKQKLFLFLAALGMLLPQVAFADAVKVGDIYYNFFDDGTAEVTYNPDGYTGEIKIPETVNHEGKTYKVKSIGYSAFYGCNKIITITIPSSVTSIEDYAFNHCTDLSSITVEAETPPSVGNSSFKDVNKYIDVYLPNCTTADAYRAANGWKEFMFFRLPKPCKIGGIYYILARGAAAVADNPDGYTGEIEIPETVNYEGKTYSVTGIGYNAFKNCSGLTSVTIPNSVKSIEEGAFSDCSGLTSITVEAETPPSVGYQCFNNVNKSIPIYLPNCTTADAYKTAYGWKEFKNFILPTPYEIGGIYYILSGGTAVVTANPDTYTDAIEIPETVSYEGITFKVTGIGNNAFNNCANMTSIVIPSSVTSIGDYAFGYCTSLTAITIPNRVVSIGEHTFQYCKNITSIYIPSSVKSIGSFAFAECTGLTSITVESETPPSVGYECFSEVKNTIPVYVISSEAADTYKAADGWAHFKNFVSPSTYKIGGIYYTLLPNGTAKVTASPDGYKGDIKIPDTVSYGGKTYNVTNIESSAFNGCSGLTSVTIPGSVTSIGDEAFSNSTDLSSVTIPNSMTSIGNGVFDNCTGLTSVTIPSSVESIGDRAFNNCTGLTSVTIPNSVESIGNGVFNNCTGLTSVTIPSSVKSIGDRAFAGCTGLTSMTVEAKTPPSVGDECFLNVDKTIPVYAPSSEIAKASRAADGWKDFINLFYYYTFEDKTEYVASSGFAVDELTYTRTFGNTDWQALYVPFSMSYDEWKDDFDIAKIVNVIQYDDNEDGNFDRTYLVVRKLTTGSTKPNYPYLVRAKSADTYTLTLTDKKLAAAASCSVECRSTESIYTFTGTYTGVNDMATPGYYALSEGILKKAASSDVPLSPQRWYLNIQSIDDDYNAATKAQSIRIVLEGEEGIEALTTTSPFKGEREGLYDLMGRSVKGSVKGISIVNGKKIIISKFGN